VLYTPRYPTPEHERAAEAVVAFFAERAETEAVLLVNSCARGQATPDSCLDIAVLIPEGADDAATEAAWERHQGDDPAIQALGAVGAFSVVHPNVLDGRFGPDPHPADEYPDTFEIAIGNALAYSVPLWERGDRLQRLRQTWLPYYGEEFRQERLAEVRWCCAHYLDHIPPYVARGLYFQAFARLWGAFQMVLQALFIDRRTYPIAYDKWIRHQVVEILGLPDLYARLPGLFEIGRLESDELVGKSRDLREILDAYVGA
jgi:predicted nucleotidyltransferase